MPGVVHVITTGNFAGAERYVCDVARETAARGWETAVVGGHPERMQSALEANVRWLAGQDALPSLRSVAALGRQDICHAHMTIGEAVSVAARPIHRAPVVSTRHFAAKRGSSLGGRLLARPIAAGLAHQIAISHFVAARLERPPDATIPNAVPPSPCLWKSGSQVVLVLQRLEAEKDTLTALRAWRSSRLADDGWVLRIVGEGSERGALEAWAASEGLESVEFSGWTVDVPGELARAGLLLASAPAEPFGLVVLEAMAAGVPVVASAAGGHLETVGALPGAVMFEAGDADGAGAALRAFADGKARARASEAGRQLVAAEFTIEAHVDRLLDEYESARRRRRTSGRPPAPTSDGEDETKAGALRELVVCSLEAWDEIWRRNQFFVEALLRRNPGLRVLFVEPPADVLFDLWSRRRPTLPRLRRITEDGRLIALRPLKPLPRRFGRWSDEMVLRQVRLASRVLGFARPTLWINDVTFAPLIADTGWPSLYDVTDDWLLAPFAPVELQRLRRLDAVALADADEIVVCSPALAASRGLQRDVSLVPNGVDVEHFRRPRPRPSDLPPSPTAVYVGSLHDARLDVDLVVDLATARKDLTVVLVGPNSLEPPARRLLDDLPNVVSLGPRPYRDVPGYLQHADVIVVPHRVSPFTESLDPIKAYEALAVDTPTVATPVAGFREHATRFAIVERDRFVARVGETLADPRRISRNKEPVSWEHRAHAFGRVLEQARRPHAPAAVAEAPRGL